MKKLKIKPKELVPYLKELEKVEAIRWKEIRKIERKMQKKFKDKDIEFFWVEGELAGVGTYPFFRKMDLIHYSEIEDEY